MTLTKVICMSRPQIYVFKLMQLAQHNTRKIEANPCRMPTYMQLKKIRYMGIWAPNIPIRGKIYTNWFMPIGFMVGTSHINSISFSLCNFGFLG